MAKNNVADLLSVGSLFTTQAERDEAQRETVRDIPLEEISDFPNHPFKVRMDESMMEMVDSVKQYGVLVPALVRPKPDGGYEMIAGHRRRMASELAEKPTLSCIVRDMTDDEATIVMVDSNLQREQILPSEKAFAYKLKLDAIRIWEQTKEQRSAQLVFCDLSTPNKNTPIEMQKNEEGIYEMIPNQFTDVYNDLKKKLMEAGVPEEEIAFIHDANTEARKKELFSKVRSGQVRILMGSTQKMGAGTNVQDRLIALHDLDCPWRPSDLAQRLGRIVRQGNLNPEVEIFRYVTEGTFDAYLYQLVENKQKFIAQIMTSKAPVRVADDVDETALSYSEIKALATGNPLIIEKCNLDMEVGKLNMLKASYLSQKYALEDMVLKKYPETITRLTERIAGYEQDLQLATAHRKPQEGFAGITILEQLYADKEAAGKAILDVCTKMTGSDAVFLGQYRGFSLVLSYDGPSNEYRMTMKGTLSHTAVLGADVFGNLTRMDNVIDGLSGKLEAVRAELADTQVQLENARTELAAPFAKEAELAEKTARLKELNILLNMDQKDKSLIDDVPDEDTPERSRSKGLER